ncbi:copper resistance D family protein (plasmid) [Sphingobium sp. RAC03]|nr:copper resistance D family protein [Sphingobium sp. RAC03]
MRSAISFGIMARQYGQLLFMKHALFAAMLAMAASDRFRLIPALETGIDSGSNKMAVARLRRSLWAEAAAGVVILGLVGWLGTLEPPDGS